MNNNGLRCLPSQNDVIFVFAYIPHLGESGCARFVTGAAVVMYKVVDLIGIET